MGVGNQFRMIGSAVIMAISTSVFNSYVRPHLAAILGRDDASLVVLGQALVSLPPDAQDSLRLVLAQGYNRQMLILCASAAAQLPAGLLMWTKDQIVA